LVKVYFENALWGPLFLRRDDGLQVKAVDNYSQILNLDFADVVTQKEPKITSLGIVMGVNGRDLSCR
jgi:hypothetical protein